MGDQAEYMEQLTVGMIVEGKVKSLTKFGAFITLPDGSTGMVHISEVAHTSMTSTTICTRATRSRS